jgi:hypothetical protein
MDVVIIPTDKLGGVYEENRHWAKQWQAADPDKRRIVTLADSTPESVVKATRAAARIAGAAGTVIYATGHGGAGEAPTTGLAELAPKGGFRLSQFLAFSTASTKGWVAPNGEELPPVSQIEGDLKKAKTPKQVRAWCGQYFAKSTPKEEARLCRIGVKLVRERSRLQQHYDAIGEIYRESKVRRVVLLTCNVGKGSSFLNEVSTDWGVPVAGYTRRVMSRWESQGTHNKVYSLYLEGDKPGSGTNVSQSSTQLMPGLGPDDEVVGRVQEPAVAAPRPSICYVRDWE